MLLLNINRKAYMGSPIGVITFDLSDSERSRSLVLYLVKEPS